MKSFDKQFWKALGWSALMAVGAGFLLVNLTCCTTVQQAPVQSKQASWDTVPASPATATAPAAPAKQEQDSGIISVLGDPPTSYTVTAHFRDRYNALISVYGNSKLADGAPIFSPALRKDDGLFAEGDGTWIMDQQHMEDMVALSRLKRRGAKP